jgi:membrane peptidoglycan carboxypeptidase
MRKFLNVLVKSVVALLLVANTAIVAAVGWLYWHYEYGIGLPDRQKLVAVSARDRTCSSGGERNFVPFAAIPTIVRDALIASEGESDFFDRPPVNFFAELASAAMFNRTPRSSPISLAVTRCLMSSSPLCCKESFDRHMGTIILMHRVERAVSKETIFELYLNETYFGRGAYGAGAAAQAYFGKSLSDLTLEEAAYIAALVRAPNSINRNNERGTARRNLVIDRMRDAGMISPAQAASAQQQPLSLRDGSAPI